MTKNFNLELAVKKSLGLVKQSIDRPFLIVVYGLPDSGKSYYSEKLEEVLRENDLSVYVWHMAPWDDLLHEIKEACPEDIEDVIVFNCEWDRIKENTTIYVDRDPDSLSDSILGKKINLNVGIYNPNHSEIPKGSYDLVISNPDSVYKGV